MANFTQYGGIRIHGANANVKVQIDSTMNVNAYSAISDVLAKGGISTVSCLDRRVIPADKIIRGNGTTAEYRKGLIYLQRENSGTACIEGLIPKDDDKKAALKTALMSKTFGGEKPTSVTFVIQE